MLAVAAFFVALVGCLLAVANLRFKSEVLDFICNYFCSAVAIFLALFFADSYLVSGNVLFVNLSDMTALVAMLLELFEFGAFVFCRKRTFTLIAPITFVSALLLFISAFVLKANEIVYLSSSVPGANWSVMFQRFLVALGLTGVTLSGIVFVVTLIRPTKARYDLLYKTLAFGGVFTLLGVFLK